MGHSGRAQWGHERETESELRARVGAGDMAAFAELVGRVEGPAFAVARAIVDAATAEDVVADSLERLLIVLKRGEGPSGALRPYFLQMVRNRAIDHWRRGNEVPTDVAAMPAVMRETADDADSATVREAFTALPERWQTALWLGVVESRSHAEIGRELDVAEGAASQLLHRAREGLRQSYLDAHLGADGDCEALSGLIGKYVRGRCSRRDARKVQTHLDACTTCRQAVARTSRLNERLGAALAVGILGGVGLMVLRTPASAWAAELGSTPGRFWVANLGVRPARQLMALGAGAVLTVGIVLMVPGNRPAGLAEPRLAASPIPAAAPVVGVVTPAPAAGPRPVAASIALPRAAARWAPAVPRGDSSVGAQPAPVPSRPVDVTLPAPSPPLGETPAPPCEPGQKCGGGPAPSEPGTPGPTPSTPEPVPVESAPGEPGSVEPAPSEPAPSNPAPSEPAPSESSKPPSGPPSPLLPQ